MAKGRDQQLLAEPLVLETLPSCALAVMSRKTNDNRLTWLFSVSPRNGGSARRMMHFVDGASVGTFAICSVTLALVMGLVWWDVYDTTIGLCPWRKYE